MDVGGKEEEMERLETKQFEKEWLFWCTESQAFRVLKCISITKVKCWYWVMWNED